MEMLDPIWTESNWDVIGLRVYTMQTAAYDRLVLLGGISITVLAYLAILITKSIITKAMKQDWNTSLSFWRTLIMEASKYKDWSIYLTR